MSVMVWLAAAGMYQCLRGLRSSHLYPSHRLILTQCINYLSGRGWCSVLEAACSVWLMLGREERPGRRLRMDTEAGHRAWEGWSSITWLDCYSPRWFSQPLSSDHPLPPVSYTRPIISVITNKSWEATITESVGTKKTETLTSHYKHAVSTLVIVQAIIWQNM